MPKRAQSAVLAKMPTFSRVLATSFAKICPGGSLLFSKREMSFLWDGGYQNVHQQQSDVQMKNDSYHIVAVNVFSELDVLFSRNVVRTV